MLKKDLTERQMLWSVRWAILAVSIFSLLTALYFQDVYQLMVKSFSILMVGLFVPMTAAIYWKKANAPAALASLIVGMTSWSVLEVWKARSGIAEYPVELVAAGAGLVVLVVVTLVTQKHMPALPATDIEGNPVEYKDRLGILGFGPR